MFSQQSKHANRKGNVRRCGNCPTTNQGRVAASDNQVGEGGNGHSRTGGNHRQPSICPACQMAIDKFAFYFQPDQQEENRHQRIVDPQMDSHSAQLWCQFRAGDGMDCMKIVVSKNGIGAQYRNGGDHH